VCWRRLTNAGVFDEHDASLLAVTAAHAAIAINNARLLRATRKALQKVKEADELKRNFLTLASHELRTPLGIILGYSSFLKEDAKGELSEHADQVLSAATQMRSILDEMNNLAMLKSDEMTQSAKLPWKTSLHAEGIKDIASAQTKSGVCVRRGIYRQRGY
jgi:signal transduction histidine kinase